MNDPTPTPTNTNNNDDHGDDEVVMPWSEWWPRARKTLLIIEPFILAYIAVVFYVLPPDGFRDGLLLIVGLMQLYVLARVLGWRYGVTHEDIY